jgi:glycosyltransferase involved in cell wall biosynthesis
MVLVSVVIPTFGRPELVSRAVRGVLAQTMADLEVIVVIDGDDPATVAALEAIEAGDARLRHIVHAQKSGAGQARDTGADNGRGNWFAFLDDDDEWEPDKLQRQLDRAASEPGPVVVMSVSRAVSSYGTFHRPGEIYDNAMPIDEWLFDRRTWTRGGEAFLQTSSLMMPRGLFDVLHFTDTKQHEEWELVIRAVKQHGYRLVTDERPSVIYYIPERRASLSLTYTWKRSLDWVMGMRAVLTKRAFSGFCLTVAAENAASTGDRSAMTPLLRAAFAHGAPTPKQLFAFSYYFMLPEHWRRRVRGKLQGQ